MLVLHLRKAQYSSLNDDYSIYMYIHIYTYIHIHVRVIIQLFVADIRRNLICLLHRREIRIIAGRVIEMIHTVVFYLNRRGAVYVIINLVVHSC